LVEEQYRTTSNLRGRIANPDSLEVNDAEALVDVVRSRGDVAEERLALIREHVAEAIDRDGSFHVTKDTARIRCRKP
jgi:hypothetical protein